MNQQQKGASGNNWQNSRGRDSPTAVSRDWGRGVSGSIQPKAQVQLSIAPGTKKSNDLIGAALSQMHTPSKVGGGPAFIQGISMVQSDEPIGAADLKSYSKAGKEA